MASVTRIARLKFDRAAQQKDPRVMYIYNIGTGKVYLTPDVERAQVFADDTDLGAAITASGLSGGLCAQWTNNAINYALLNSSDMTVIREIDVAVGDPLPLSCVSS